MALLLCLILFAPKGHAQTPDSIRQEALRDVHGSDLQGKDGPLAKAGLDLLLLYHTYQAKGTDGIQAFAQSDAGMRIQNGHVTIDAIAADEPEALQADLETLGLTNAASAGRMVSGRVPIEKIPELAALSTLRSVQPSRVQTRSTSQTSVSNRDALVRKSMQQNRTATDTSSSPPDSPATTPRDTSETAQRDTRATAQEDAPAATPSETDTTIQDDPTSGSAPADTGTGWGLTIVVGGLAILGGLLLYLWSS